MVLVQFVHGYELVEDVIVEHEQHGGVGEVVLYAEESFAGVVRLHVLHLAAAYDLLVLGAVGCEGHTSVEEHFQVGPHLVDELFS